MLRVYEHLRGNRDLQIDILFATVDRTDRFYIDRRTCKAALTCEIKSK